MGGGGGGGGGRRCGLLKGRALISYSHFLPEPRCPRTSKYLLHTPTSYPSPGIYIGIYIYVSRYLHPYPCVSNSALITLTLAFTDYSLLTTHYSLLTTHRSLLTTHYSLLTTHRSPLTTHYSLLTLLTTHSSLLTTHSSLLTTHYSLLTTHYSHFSLLTIGVLAGPTVHRAAQWLGDLALAPTLAPTPPVTLALTRTPTPTLTRPYP